MHYNRSKERTTLLKRLFIQFTVFSLIFGVVLPVLPGRLHAAESLTINDTDSYGISMNIVDYTYHQIRQFDGENFNPDPKAIVFITGLPSGASVHNGLAVHPTEDLFYAYGTAPGTPHALYRISLDGTAQIVANLDGVAGNADISHDGSLYYYSYVDNGQLLLGSYNLVTGEKDSIPINGYPGNDTGGDLVIDGEGYIWFSNNNAGSIIQLDPRNGEVLRQVPITSGDGEALRGGVRGLSFLPNGQMLLSSGPDNRAAYFSLNPETLQTTFLGAVTIPGDGRFFPSYDLASRVYPSFEPNPPVLESKKTAKIQEKAVGNTDADHPEEGDTLLYTIQTRNTIENSLVKNLVVSDTLPGGLNYVSGSLKVEGISVTDAQGDDQGHYTAGLVVVQFGDITDTDWHTVEFQATIQAGQAGKDIRNVGEVNGSNIATPDNPEEFVKVYPTNQPPIVPKYEESTLKNTPVTGSVIGLDPDGDSLTYTLGANPQNGTVTVNADGTWTYTPGPNYTGLDSFEVTVSDGKGGTATSTVTIDVTEPTVPPNRAPTAPNYRETTPKNTSVTGSVYGEDPDGDPLTYTPGSDPQHGTLILNTDGTWIYTPDPGYVGPDIFTVIVSDGKGGTTTSTITIDVTDPGPPTPPPGTPNQPPTVPDYNVTTDKDKPATGTVKGADPDGDPLTYRKGKGPDHGTVTVNPDGTWTYTPDPGYVGSDSFTVIVDDGNGGTETATITIDVKEPATPTPTPTPEEPSPTPTPSPGGDSSPSNQPPTVSDDSVTTPKDTPVSGTVKGSDPDGDPLTYGKGKDAEHGKVTVNPDGTWTYTPDSGYVGQDSFTVIVDDERGGKTEVTIAIDVKESATTTPPQGTPNQPPTVSNDNVTTPKDTPVTGTVKGTDPDGDPLTYGKGKDPEHGTATVNPDGAWTYTPDSNYVGQDSFTVIVDDGKGGKTEVTITVDVTEPGTSTPTPGTSDQSSNTSDQSSGKSGTVESGGRRVITEGNEGDQPSNRLPNTATNLYNLGFIGVVALLTGWLLRRKSNKVQ